MNLEQRFQHAADCIEEDMEGELLVYQPSSTQTVHLNGSSMLVWKLCDGQNTVADVIELLQENYPDQADQIASDVPMVVEDLQGRGLLVA